MDAHNFADAVSHALVIVNEPAAPGSVSQRYQLRRRAVSQGNGGNYTLPMQGFGGTYLGTLSLTGTTSTTPEQTARDFFGHSYRSDTRRFTDSISISLLKPTMHRKLDGQESCKVSRVHIELFKSVHWCSSYIITMLLYNPCASLFRSLKRIMKDHPPIVMTIPSALVPASAHKI